MENIGKIDISKYQPAAENKILTDIAVLTNNRREHIIERRGQDFFDKYSPMFADIISDPDYIFKDKNKNTALAAKFVSDGEHSLYICLRLSVEGDDPKFKNSVITAVFENRKRFLQRIKNNPPFYKKLDKPE
ncbi:MAG: PBECR2 nuclease fold domain-containing protein [Ruminococcus sp.]|nr:PBECR2 nuclease fold domain-containing protein [Ruminococcus sp.]MCM1480557.1 PBECR2 nuclease fold domain-containing protein [Muribaculaceae bacterium]